MGCPEEIIRDLAAARSARAWLGRRQKDVAVFCLSGLPRVLISFAGHGEALQRAAVYRRAVRDMGVSRYVEVRTAGDCIRLTRRDGADGIGED